LTGRENVYLNGAILGMRRREIARKFDEIVSFAEVEKFMDTPVKHYSSGMYVRLAFAVAAHLETEILVVDEVLAVGDISFQRKCLGAMGNIVKGGRTVLFVSHNTAAIQELCPKALQLERGRLVQYGPSDSVIARYLAMGREEERRREWPDIKSAPGNESLRIKRICVRPESGAASDPITMEAPFVVEVEYWNLLPDEHLHITLHFRNEQGIIAFSTWTELKGSFAEHPPRGLLRSVCHVPGNLLNSGFHDVLVMAFRNNPRLTFKYPVPLGFHVQDLKERDYAWYGQEPGIFVPKLSWNSEILEPCA
jgi:lipopolysaccharide transport system ATP-binding protein